MPVGLLVRESLVRMYLPYCVPCPHSPLSQVPSRCTTEPSSSLSVSLGPSSRLHLQGMEWAGGHRWDCRQHLTCTPLCVSINLTHHCLPSSPHVSAPSRFPGPSVLAHLQPHRYVPSPTTPPITPVHNPSVPARVHLQVPAHPWACTPWGYTRTSAHPHPARKRTPCTHPMHPPLPPRPADPAARTPGPGRASPRAAVAALPVPAMAAGPRLRRAVPPASGAGDRGHRAAEARAEGPARRYGTAGSGGPGVSPPGGHRGDVPEGRADTGREPRGCRCGREARGACGGAALGRRAGRAAPPDAVSPQDSAMASRGGPRAAGTDGSDFQHRERVASHYQMR